MNKTFTIEEIKALYHNYEHYVVEWDTALNKAVYNDNLSSIMKQLLSFYDWLDVHEQGNNKLIYY